MNTTRAFYLRKYGKQYPTNLVTKETNVWLPSNQYKKMEDTFVATLELSELFANDILLFLSDIEVETANHTHQNSIVGGAEPGSLNLYPINGEGLKSRYCVMFY